MIINRERMASALISLGYEVSRQWQFRLRADENTPSAKINTNGSVHDFGSGWHGDLISLLLDYKGMSSFVEAKNEAKKLLGQEFEIDFTKFDKTNSEVNEESLPDSFMIPHRVDREHNRQSYLAELKQLFLGQYDGKQYLSANWSNILEVSKKYDIGFIKKSGRLIMAIRDIDNSIKTFWKYKKNGNNHTTQDGKVIKHRKVLYTKGRSRPPFAIQDLIEYANTPEIPVIICEGEKDCLVAIANGLNAICIGGAGASKKIKEEYLHLFKNLKVIIAGDYDKAGVEFNLNLLNQLNQKAKSVTILRWEQKAIKDGFKLHKKFDLSDYFAWKNNN